MSELSLYNSCLLKVSRLVRDGIWKSITENPFHCLPTGILHDLFNTILLFNDFSPADLELLLATGRLQKFKMHDKNVKRKLGLALKSLSSASQNLEVLILTNLTYYKPDPSEALEELLMNSPNLKDIHSEVEFNLKALRNCKKLRTLLLHFNPRQPWYDFLEDEHGCLQPLDSLEIFTICVSFYYEFQSVFSDYIVTLLRYCPALSSLGLLESSRALSHLYQTGILTRGLRCCCWGKSKDPIKPEFIRDAMICNPFVEELYITTHCSQIIANLSSLRYLVFLDIQIFHLSDISELFCNVFKDIGLHLKYLSIAFSCPVDISAFLQHCPHLEALELRTPTFAEFAIPAVKLPNLKHLAFAGNEYGEKQRVLPLFSDCHSLTELFMCGNRGCDDETLDKFLRRNSLSKLKVAYLRMCCLTERGFKKLFLNAPKLEKIEVTGYSYNEKEDLQRNVKNALLETNHKALFNRNFFNVYDSFFFKKRRCDFYPL